MGKQRECQPAVHSMNKSRLFFALRLFHPTRASLPLCGLLLLASCLAASCQPLNEQTPLPSLSPSPTNPPAARAPSTPQPTASPLAAPLSSPTPNRCAQTTGTLAAGVIDTKLLDKPMRYNVYLPPCYTAEADKHYPALYLLHGQNYDEEQWRRIGIVEAADRLMSAGEIPPLLVIMPYDYSFKQPYQYNFEQVFIEMLLPRIDLDYRTLPGAKNRAVGGLSRGGAWAIRLGTRHPDLFEAVGAHSPALFYSDVETMPVRLRDADPNHFPRFYIDVGIYDSEYESARPFAELLDQMNIIHEWHEYIGFHEEKYWSAHLEEYLRWYAEAWQ